jgi:DNA repair protein RecN (Recombination protein N)
MLRELSIKNFAIIDDLSITFEEGFTVLTGETGAGKSIIINAINLVLGGRPSPEMIRTSEETAEVEALFEVPPGSLAAQGAQAQGLDASEGLLVRRLIHCNGRHRTYLNGRLATARMLSALNEQLASISGQHAHHGLLRPDQHLLVLDQFGGLMGSRGRVEDAYRQTLPLIRAVAELKRQATAQTQHRDLLEFQCREIQQAKISDGEDDALEQERQRLKHAQQLYEAAGRCIERLYGGDGAVVEHVTEIAKELKGLSPIDSSLAPAAERVQDAAFQLEDVARDLQGYVNNLVFDGERLEAVEQRLDLLYGLMRKYGGSLESVVTYGRKAVEELQRLSSLPQQIAEQEQRLQAVHTDLTEACRALSGKRQEASESLSEKVRAELAKLEMSGTRFKVRFEPSPVAENVDSHLVVDGCGVDGTGIDRVEFLIAPNVGEALRPLAQIASGGELSRIMLALKAILATKASVETLIFDEVDAGIGGRVSEVVGRNLRALSQFHQVLCITHLPQIAQFGEHHFKIVKEVRKGRTRTSIKPLQGEERVKEMARMLGGLKVTKKTLDHAREMLANR